MSGVERDTPLAEKLARLEQQHSDVVHNVYAERNIATGDKQVHVSCKLGEEIPDELEREITDMGFAFAGNRSAPEHYLYSSGGDA